MYLINKRGKRCLVASYTKALRIDEMNPEPGYEVYIFYVQENAYDLFRYPTFEDANAFVAMLDEHSKCAIDLRSHGMDS